jgi:hypothetical protein
MIVFYMSNYFTNANTDGKFSKDELFLLNDRVQSALDYGDIEEDSPLYESHVKNVCEKMVRDFCDDGGILPSKFYTRESMLRQGLIT